MHIIDKQYILLVYMPSQITRQWNTHACANQNARVQCIWMPTCCSSKPWCTQQLNNVLCTHACTYVINLSRTRKQSHENFQKHVKSCSCYMHVLSSLNWAVPYVLVNSSSIKIHQVKCYINAFNLPKFGALHSPGVGALHSPAVANDSSRVQAP